MNFQIPEQKRNDFLNQFYKDFSDKWTKDNSNIHYQLKKITKFSIDEINLIDQKYPSQEISEQQNYPNSQDLDQQKNEENRNKSESFIKFNKKGINKQEFTNLMIKFNKQYNADHKIIIKDEQLSKIFDLFIELEEGVLDFREFLCCMSIVTRGDVKEKLEMFFYVFDANKKQYLSKNEFFFLIDTLVHSIAVIDKNIELKEQAANFLVSLEDEYMNKEKISLSDFLLLLSSPFIQELTYLQHNQFTSRNTLKLVTSNMKNLYE